jgi:pimeloyl-ACP methyl ester carboxylesterase
MAKPAVIMVHGAFCGGWAFDQFKTPFEKAGYACQTPDLKGHGSGQSPVGVSMSDYAVQVADLIRAQPAPPVLIGHSLGGLVAQMAASRAKVRALILMAPSPPWGVTGGSVEEAVSAVTLYALGPFWLQAIEPDYVSARHYSLDRLDKAARKAVFARMVPESGRALWETLNWWLDPFMTTKVSPKRITAPVLGYVGDRDLIHPAATVRQTLGKLGGETRVMPGMSHWLLSEPGWEAVADGCLDWLAQQAETVSAA